MKALLIISLVALSYGFQASKQLPSLQTANFGTLFSEIKSQIKAGGPMANIEGLLNDLKDQIHHEQREHDEMLARNGASCADEKEFRETEIQEGSVSLRRASNHLSACQNSEEKAKVDLENTQQDIADSRAALTVATQRRDEGHELFLKRSTDHRNALNVVRGSLQILDDLVAEEASLAQLSAHTSMLLRTGVKVNLSHHYAPVIALFAQMATSEFDMFLDAGSVGRIRNMLEQLYENVENSLEDYANEESAAQDNFNTLKNRLENSIRDLEGNAQALEDHLEEMAQCVLEEKLLVAKSSEKVDRNTKLLRLTHQMCDAFVEEFNAATESRKEEQELLKTVRKMVKRRLEGVGHSVRQRDDSFHVERQASYQAGEFEHNGGNADHALEGFGMDEDDF